jgi:hypothetical protein
MLNGMNNKSKNDWNDKFDFLYFIYFFIKKQNILFFFY